jgi:hypothetical protein
MTAPYGYCHCGCGEKTHISRQTNNLYGHKKGQPVSFLPGHNHRFEPKGEKSTQWKGGRSITKGGYVRIYNPTHPRASHNYVLEHILIVEKVIDRFLKDKEEVHHVNEIKSDNRNENLVLCPDRAYHFLLHLRQRAFVASGNANYRKCRYCKQYDDPNNMKEHKREKNWTPYFVHKSCQYEHYQNRYMKNKSI